MTQKSGYGHWRLRWAITLLTALVTIGGAIPTARAQGLGSDPRFGTVQAIDAPQKGAEAGVRWERIMFPWAMMQPSSSDELLPTYYSDDRIASQAQSGVTEVGVIVYTPAWAAIDPNRGWSAVPRGLDLPISDSRNVFARFVSRLAEKYRGTVDHWIVWNEPDLVNLETGISGNWAGTERELWQLQKTAYLAIKQANPNATVMLPGFSYWHSKEIGKPQYLKRLLDVAAGDSTSPQNNWYFDGVTAHAYGNPFNSFALPEMYRRILSERGLERKPIWITEANVIPWDDPIGVIPREPWRATMDEQASFVVESLALALAANVERMNYYKLLDEQAEDGQFFGLVRSDGSTRPAYRAMQTAFSAFSGVTNARLTWDGSADPLSAADMNRLIDSLQPHFQFVCPCQVAQVAMERAGQRITVLWNTGPKPLTAVVQAAGANATLLMPSGTTSPLVAQGDELRVYLSGARSDTEPRDGSVRLVGGRPVILVEGLGSGARSSRPPRVEPATRYGSGFSIANSQFLDYVSQNGGVESMGQPVSREFDLFGAPTQIFQRRILQLSDDGSAQPLDLAQLRINQGGEPNVGELLRSALTGQNLSSQQEAALRGSPALRQYDPGQSAGLRATAALPRSNLKYAFEPE
jgi:hypothetical protein